MTADWPQFAACKDKPPKWWFPDDSRTPMNAMKAKEVCAGCPVREECLQFAITTHQEYGIWGGMERRERKSQRKYRVIYCNDCGRRFSWMPGEDTDRPPKYCSALCRRKASNKGKAASRLRRIAGVPLGVESEGAASGS